MVGPSSNVIRQSSLTRHSRIFLKLENLQPSGSFKMRGLGNYCAKALAASKQPHRVHFYTSSGGNAGLACVCAANALKRPSTVVVPMTTKPMMIAKIKAAGASEVVQKGSSWKEADDYLREHVMKSAEDHGEEAVYVHPFDRPDVWAGHETLMTEVGEQFRDLGITEPADAVVCSVGGGGLFVGVSQGLQKIGWDGTKTVVLESVGAESLAKSLEADKHITLPGITSMVTSLGAVRVADRAFEIARQGKAAGKLIPIVLTDAEAAMGSWRFADDERFLVEPACGINIALCYDGRLSKALGRPVKPEDKVVVVVCGGSNVSTSMLEGWRKEFGIVDGAVPQANGDVPSSATAP